MKKISKKDNGARAAKHAAPQFDKGGVRYRIPFSYLSTDEERRADAWNSVRKLFAGDPFFARRMQGGVPDEQMISRDSCCPTTIFESEEGSLHAWFSPSDLWVTISPGNGEGELSQQADLFFLGMKRIVYKYVFEKNGLKAYPNRNNKWAERIRCFLGIDSGSISINSAVVDESGIVLETDYTLTEGDVLNNIKKSLARLHAHLPINVSVEGSGVTGSGHEIAMAVVDADIYETELDAHAEATMHLVPGVQVIFDIGGQDSKVMYIEDGVLDDAGMNKKCGAGTGAFLDAQAARLGIPIEEFGPVSLQAKKPYAFSSMCTVFVGRDLISEQAKGNTRENIIAGLHKSLAKNFFSTLGIDKKRLRPPIVFQGGVAANIGVKRALEECLEEARGERCEIIVPMHNNVMGAIGMALLAGRRAKTFKETRFRGFQQAGSIVSVFTECDRFSKVGCNRERICDLVKLYVDKDPDRTLYACSDYYECIQ
jgi:predicted CoA-substrate-specific enzyme activase